MKGQRKGWNIVNGSIPDVGRTCFVFESFVRYDDGDYDLKERGSALKLSITKTSAPKMQ